MGSRNKNLAWGFAGLTGTAAMTWFLIHLQRDDPEYRYSPTFMLVLFLGLLICTLVSLVLVKLDQMTKESRMHHYLVTREQQGATKRSDG